MFGTSGIRGPVGRVITADLALDVGRALASQGAKTIVVGRDPRESGSALADAVSAGARECGADVIRLGVAATPTIARSVGWLDADAGVAVTASHNPSTDNGFKLWTPSGQAFDRPKRREITRRINSEAFEFADWDGHGSEWSWDQAIETHANRIETALDPIRGLTVAVDVGNGAGGVVADALERLGCSVETLNGQPDGRFPGRPSEPTAENCKSLCEFVAATDADLGIAHDGDADRMMAVTETGEFVSGDVLLALFAREAVRPGKQVAVPVDTSLLVDDVVTEAGGSVVRTKVGDVYVAAEAAKPDVVFGGEPSGAWIWPDETLCPDGPFAACQLAWLVSKQGPLSSLVSSIERYPIRRKSIRVDDELSTIETVQERLTAQYAAVDTTDGVRVERDDGWFLVRASGTEPIIRLTAEARTDAEADALLAEVSELVEASREKVPRIDLSD
ncbi:phosphoglucosamine mutase [Haloprofundus marisrubri]|uniref:Phosphoglucosamine mutase n=1 Tax=Haloprofundus marisrubri TaxID=1514971 RepID=A0A0W1R4Q2_9EURY|nr:phosphoglucosamine mutase [Haloprofundus marisrubri]KTG07839.1 phosphoglucosamine mutase [Haloprofundus marisrubri]